MTIAVRHLTARESFARFVVALGASLVVNTACLEASAQPVQSSAATSTAGGVAISSVSTVTFSVGQAISPGRAESGSFSVISGFLAASEASVDVRAPLIEPVSFSGSEAGQDVTVMVTITDDAAIEEAVLHYRRGGELDFMRLPLNEAEEHFIATLPGSDVTPGGIEYYVTASDPAGNSARAPAAGVYALRVTISGEGLVREEQQPAGRLQSAYRIVSWPLEMDDRRASVVLRRDLGTADSTRWRFFELLPPSEGRQGVREGPADITIDPGRGYWLIVAEGTNLSTGPATSISTDEAFRIPLHEGWNLVANPFNFPISINQVSTESGKTLDIRTFIGEWAPFSSAMEPFDGYAVVTEDQAADVLVIDPIASGASSKELESIRPADPSFAWSLRIAASSPSGRDADNVAAVVEGASKGFDRFDRPEPPSVGNFLSLAFPHGDWGKPLHDFAVDVRPEEEEGYDWRFLIRSPRTEEAEIRIAGGDGVPSHLRIVLIDELLNIRRDLRDDPAYSFTTAGPDGSRAFYLLVGSDDYVAAKTEELGPVAFELSQNFPNPFSGVTTIRYGIEKPSVVTLTIYDLLGRQVATLIRSEDREAGYHAVVWDGRDGGGAQVASGVYFYVLRANERTAIGKMSLVR